MSQSSVSEFDVLIIGLSEKLDELQVVVRDLRAHGCHMVTVGQYLAPSNSHLPVERYYTPDELNFPRC